MSPHTEKDELGDVEKGVTISIWVIGTALLAGLLLTAVGYPWAMRRVPEFVGIYVTLAGGVWVTYILYDLVV